jgi:Putative MetA-pathway of phenol degradation
MIVAGWAARAVGAALAGLIVSGVAAAQDMEPRAYSASPIGANFLVTAFTWSTGAVVLDPALPITDVQADVQGIALALGHSFNLFGNLALVTAAMPYAVADVSGKVLEQQSSISRSGLADARVKFSVNLRGNPAMTAREFAAAPPRTVVGASVNVTAPAGQYYGTKLINLGTNRWSFKPEVGVAVPKGRWDLDGYVGVTFFTPNANFFPDGRRRTQDPVLSLQGHASYTVRPRLWVAFDATWYRGGSARVDDGDRSEGMNNSRLGVTLSLPVGRRYSAKVAVGSGVVARTGTDFSTVAIAWQVLWLSPRWSGR